MFVGNYTDTNAVNVDEDDQLMWVIDGQVFNMRWSQWRLLMSTIPEVSVSGATYTILTSDQAKEVRATNVADKTFTIPSTSGFLPGAAIVITNRSSTNITLVASGTTLNAAASVISPNQSAMIKPRAGNEWDVYLGSGTSESTLSPEDEVTSAYADLVGATTPERTALLTATGDLVDAALYDLIFALWPFVGDSKDNKRYNLLDPQDDDLAYRLTYPGGDTIASVANGIELNADADDMDTHIDPDVDLAAGIPSIGVSYYIQENDKITLFTNGSASFYAHHYDGPNAYISLGGGSSTPIAVSGGNLPGLHTLQRVDGSTINYWRNGVKIGEVADSAGSWASGGNVLIAYNPLESGPKTISFAAIHNAFDDTQAAAFYTIIQSLMTALGRDV